MSLILTKLSETNTDITLGWTPPSNVYGYGFFSDGIWRSNGSALLKNGAPRNSVKFQKGLDP